MSWFWFFLAWGALYLALRYSAEVMAAERRARIVQALAHNAQLRALQNQISPHFMFNTLNSISALMLDGAVRAAESMLRQLSEFLRATLALDALSDISLAEELRIQLMYLAIEEARFPDMSVEVDCPDALGDALVPALISQPIVENAVKYGVAGSTGATRIAIAARESGGQLVLTIEDDGRGQGAKSGGLGVGLRNVRDRLRSRFGDAHGFQAGPRAEGGYRVELSMPLTRAIS
jgi:LytS/YehU family sensor histidine kinase